MFDPDRHTRREPIHYDTAGQAISTAQVILEPFSVPSWVRSQADYDAALAAYVTAQIDRGVSRTRIVEHLATHVGGEHSDAEGYYRAVAKLRRRKLRRVGWEMIIGGLFTMAVGGGLFSMIYLFPDAGDLLTPVPQWLGYIIVGAFVAVIVGGVVGGLVSIVKGAWRVVRYVG